jgi:hypothetical protein
MTFVFPFIVMPTCALVTAKRERSIELLRYRPMSCAQMYPTGIRAPDVSSVNGHVFESLCWSYSLTMIFETIFGALLSLILSIVSITATLSQIKISVD